MWCNSKKIIVVFIQKLLGMAADCKLYTLISQNSLFYYQNSKEIYLMFCSDLLGINGVRNTIFCSSMISSGQQMSDNNEWQQKNPCTTIVWNIFGALFRPNLRILNEIKTKVRLFLTIYFQIPHPLVLVHINKIALKLYIVHRMLLIKNFFQNILP